MGGCIIDREKRGKARRDAGTRRDAATEAGASPEKENGDWAAWAAAVKKEWRGWELRSGNLGGEEWGLERRKGVEEGAAWA